MQVTTRLVILDPGLNEIGGHHPAVLESVKSALAVNGNSGSAAANESAFEVRVYCNKRCPEAFVNRQQLQRVSCIPYFITDYYRYFYQPPTNTELTEYTLCLAQEYRSVILAELKDATSQKGKSSRKLLFWCHSINWEHAGALALALESLKAIGFTKQLANLKLIAGLMYHPLSRAPNDEVGILKQQMRYELAFKRLAAQEAVTLFAADLEIQHYLSARLGCELGIQPCLLLGDYVLEPQPPTLEKQNAKLQRVILFLGDAKENKGFTQLPTLIELMLSKYPNIEFVVQYSNSDASKITGETAVKIRLLIQQYPNLRHIDEYLSHQEMMELFNTSDAVVFQYDQASYQHQSSGVLWLAAYFGLAVISLTETLISREAKRLGLAYYSCKSIDESVSLVGQLTLNSKPRVTRNIYFQTLFTDIALWLSTQC